MITRSKMITAAKGNVLCGWGVRGGGGVCGVGIGGFFAQSIGGIGGLDKIGGCSARKAWGIGGFVVPGIGGTFAPIGPLPKSAAGGVSEGSPLLG